MKVVKRNGESYRIPSALSDFQLEMYLHLIDWKWEHITREPGEAHHRPFDAILPKSHADRFPTIYPGVVQEFQRHQAKSHFRTHKFFNHMASSQAANANLFLPVVTHPNADAILGTLRPDFTRLATDRLDKGYRLEFWDQPHGHLGDRGSIFGTDADIAIAYFNHQGDLCLWLIEHKLTEAEFTTCRAATSRSRQPSHDCGRSFSEILENPSLCYYHDARGFKYWDITRKNRDFFPNHPAFTGCPFRGGLNQLWRNQLLALSVEQETQTPYDEYKHVSFSVVKHPRNTALDSSLAAYRRLIGDNPEFLTFSSADVLRAAESFGDSALQGWIDWYRDFYVP